MLLNTKTQKHMVGVVTFSLFSFLTSAVLAGEAIIENGTTFTDTFTKDGRTVEVIKTYTYGKVTIHQKIWDENGNLLRDKVTEKDLKPNVVIVGSESNDQVPTPTPTPTPVTKAEEVDSNDAALSNESTQDTDLLELEEGTQKIAEESVDETEKLIETVQKIENLNTVESAYVGRAVNTSDENVHVTISGTKTLRLLGLFPITTQQKMTYDADTWQLVEKQQSFVLKLVELLSVEN